MNTHLLTNARIVTPTQNFEGSVSIENGVIVDIIRGRHYREGVDLGGQWLTPGCIDIHSDYLEKELHPRPDADFPLPFALHFLDARAAACGLTTVFSAISFSDNLEKARSILPSFQLAHQLDEVREGLLVRHFLHARIDPNMASLPDHLPEMQTLKSLYLVVYNENIPGQRQFTLDFSIQRRAKNEGISLGEAREQILRKIEAGRAVNHRGLIQSAFGDRCVIGSHDDTTVEHVREGQHYGALLSEMPTTIEAAREARRLGLWIAMGAPNYYRGGSHCGNLSCHQAMKEDLVDMLCSDYHFPTLLGSVVRMMEEGLDPSKAINLVSLNPARLLKMDGTMGSIELGKTADLISFSARNSVPVVSHVWVDGVVRFSANYKAVVGSTLRRESVLKTEL